MAKFNFHQDWERVRRQAKELNSKGTTFGISEQFLTKEQKKSCNAENSSTGPYSQSESDNEQAVCEQYNPS